MATTEAYAKALLAQKAKELREAANAVVAHTTDQIELHHLAEVVSECVWCERTYGESK